MTSFAISARPLLLLQLWLLALLLPTSRAQSADPIEAVSFHAVPGGVLVPLDEACRHLKWRVDADSAGSLVLNRTHKVAVGNIRQLIDGPVLIDIRALQRAGAQLETDDTGVLNMKDGRRGFATVLGAQRVEISLKEQRLRAWQGSRLVLQTRISSGRNNATPAGNFRAGPFRSRMHYSSLFDNAPMPWSVQVHGHIFVHGFKPVPDYPTSHGCIRLPLNQGNPARLFYEWVGDGTPVHITRD